MKVMLRVVLTVLLVVLGLEVGIKLAPKLASLTGNGRRGTVSGLQSSGSRAAQPDWGGGSLSLSNRSASSIVDSIRTASEGDPSSMQTYSGPSGVVAEREPATVWRPGPALIVRGVFWLPPASGHEPQAASLLDISGRKVP